MTKLFPLLPKAPSLFLFLFVVVYLVSLIGGAFFVFVPFFSPFSTRSAWLPFPQVPLQEPFLNAQANKRENVSFHGWQDNQAQRQEGAFAAVRGHPQAEVGQRRTGPFSTGARRTEIAHIS